ncbi:phosphatase PAP2 family protein [Litoreibacter janthinus]|uniref:PAP2 superfamily protein n=1 Tax=Litoreibacter janthinus TaxID=670154 RepID=A0A1I6FQ97_9RHOB|nr:phosphatase PAP2 family protein [Litoreibacter janthinus]SFR32120.1 PAP2 superfamily protein [Litoreibacter janthinus]
MMRHYLLFSLAYLACAVALVFALREQPGVLLQGAVQTSLYLLRSFAEWMPILGVFLAGSLFLTRKFGIKERILPTLYALLGCLAFSMAFSLVKTSIPYIQPFYADPLFADLDRALHFGVDPWRITHAIAAYVPPAAIVILYFMVWFLPAVFLPVFIALTDTDKDRSKRFMILYVGSWIGLGNLLAVVGSSAGPVYYDRLLGTARFSDLTIALESSGISASALGRVQENLWQFYSEGGQSLGSGISAFPSVHVGLAAVTLLYLWERSRLLAPFGVVFAVMILFSSVYHGWHYAVDGYVSIAVVTVLWAALRRRNVAIATYIPA